MDCYTLNRIVSYVVTGKKKRIKLCHRTLIWVSMAQICKVKIAVITDHGRRILCFNLSQVAWNWTWNSISKLSSFIDSLPPLPRTITLELLCYKLYIGIFISKCLIIHVRTSMETWRNVLLHVSLFFSLSSHHNNASLEPVFGIWCCRIKW
jgi:hypothetical protein